VTATAPPIAVTPGDPAGVGPDLLLAIAARDWPAPLVAITDPELLADRAAKLGLSIRLTDFHGDVKSHRKGELPVIPVPLNTPVTPGRPDPANAEHVLETLRRATLGCVNHVFAALVTGPVHKGVINAAGVPFTGHTEFFAEQTGTEQVLMVLAAPGLRVALATTHLPLSDVAAALDPERLTTTLELLHAGLVKHFGIERPRIHVLGLNPHAGEDGHLGREEIEIIEPVLNRLRNRGMDLEGPLPACTAFHPQRLAACDAVLAMYHDQGLPVLKHLGFGQAVNITFGLPFIRTSVDHGTACELAGTGRADPGSFIAAIETAIEMSERSGLREATCE